MKATGIVRRIDDLGRVVIPKEIRRTMRIREGDPLEIYTDADGEVIFKKYSQVGELSSLTAQYAEVLHKNTGLPVVITDRDRVISCAGVPKKETVERRITQALENIMENRSPFICEEGGELRFYACGGDGTANEVANGILGFDNAAMTMVPVGTGNDLLKNFGDDLEKFRDVENLWDGPVFPMDVIEVNGRYALTIGIGCTGGQHRSVAVAKALTDYLAARDANVRLRNRDFPRT